MRRAISLPEAVWGLLANEVTMSPQELAMALGLGRDGVLLVTDALTQLESEGRITWQS